MTGTAEQPEEQVAEGFSTVTGGPEATPADLASFTRALAASAREAGARAVASGQWATTTLLDAVPRISVRDLEGLKADHAGLSGAALAGELIRVASRRSATVGAAAGAIISAGQLAPPAWVAIPFELVVETIAVAAIELQLVAELHVVYQQPVTGPASHRSVVLLRAWAERRGVTPANLAAKGGLAEALGHGTRNELVRLVRRRVLNRLGRNVWTLAPLLAGAVAGAEINRRATRGLGEAVVRDLAAQARGPL